MYTQSKIDSIENPSRAVEYILKQKVSLFSEYRLYIYLFSFT